ncbi:MAG: alpha-mannosidase, partial [Anaerolineaceae bacterium 4572_32.1]
MSLLHKIRWTSRKIAARLKMLEPLAYRQHQPIPPFRFQKLDSHPTPPPVASDVDDSAWDEIPPGTYWSGPRTNFILRTSFTIPSPPAPLPLGEWRDPTALYLPIGIAGDFSHPEALAYIDGKPLAACDRHHQEIILPEKYCDGETHTLALHGWTGGVNLGIDSDTKLLMRPCEVVSIHQPTRDFIALARAALGITEHLEERDPAKHHLLNALDAAFKIIDIRHPIQDAFYESIPQAAQALRDGIAKAGPPLDVNITAIGHAHIDVAWLWTLGQTRQKAGRTFHNVLRLMEQFPEFHFTQSQPQLYDYVRQDFPELFLLGRDFFCQHFGKEAESPVLWLPDVFGYAWNLPQLIKEAGMEYFFTIKLGWNQYNRIPYD